MPVGALGLFHSKTQPVGSENSSLKINDSLACSSPHAGFQGRATCVCAHVCAHLSIACWNWTEMCCVCSACSAMACPSMVTCSRPQRHERYDGKNPNMDLPPFLPSALTTDTSFKLLTFIDRLTYPQFLQSFFPTLISITFYPSSQK